MQARLLSNNTVAKFGVNQEKFDLNPEVHYCAPEASHKICSDGASNMNVMTSGPQISPTFGETEADIFNAMMTRYITAAGVVILVYDSLLTIDDEVRERCTR